MYFVYFMACVAFAQINIQNPSSRGFEVEFSLEDYPGTGYWTVHAENSMPIDKEIIHGVNAVCSGKVRGAEKSYSTVPCGLESGTFEITLLVINKNRGDRFSEKISVPIRRRLLLASDPDDTPTASPLTNAPTVAPSVANELSQAPTKSPHTSSPSSPGGSISPSQSPSVMSQTDSPTQATIPVQTSSLEGEASTLEPKEEDDSTFLGMDFGSGSDLTMFIIFLATIVFVLFMVRFAPDLYRKYYSKDDDLQKSGSKTKINQVSESELKSVISESVIVINDKKLNLGSEVWREPVE